MTSSRKPSSFVKSLVVLGTAATLVALFGGTAFSQSSTETASATAVSVADIQSVMGAHRLEVRDCVIGDHLPGRVDIVVDFVIDTDGTVERASLVESNAGTSVDSCVLGVFDTLQFPAPNNGRTMAVRYPMIFVTGG